MHCVGIASRTCHQAFVYCCQRVASCCGKASVVGRFLDVVVWIKS